VQLRNRTSSGFGIRAICDDAAVAGQLRLFDDRERDSRSPAKRAESRFSFLNRTARPYFAPVRALLEEWFAHLPPGVQPGLRERFRKDDAGQHMGAFWELYSTFMGHASVAFTLDRYGHLFPGAESEAGGLLDTYLDAAGGHGA
jgi:hypothetical protein